MKNCPQKMVKGLPGIAFQALHGEEPDAQAAREMTSYAASNILIQLLFPVHARDWISCNGRLAALTC